MNNKKCEHVFTPWEKIAYSTFMEVYTDSLYVPDFEVKHKYWERSCKECGKVEKTLVNPEEVFTERDNNDFSLKLTNNKRI